MNAPPSTRSSQHHGTAEAAAAPAVALRTLERRFGPGTAAVDGLELEIADREFFSLIGPSGCGKTTTLRMIAGLEQPTAGRIEVNGRDVTRVPAHHRPVNTVFQQYALFPHLSIFDNVAFGLRERRTSREDVTRRVGAMLELVGLTGRDKARPRELSGGQQQRVALARSLVLEPEVLLLDEPLGALDLKLRRQMQIVLKRLQRDVGITFIYVTHDQEEAFSMSDRVAVMRDGRIEQIGTPQQVYLRPRTAFVADFLGSPNRLRGSVIEARGSDPYRVDLAAAGTGETPGVAGLEDGQSILAVIRPEAIFIDERERAFSLSGEIVDVAFLGPQVTYVIDVGDGHDRLNVAVAHHGEAEILALGRRVHLSWGSSDLWLVPDI